MFQRRKKQMEEIKIPFGEAIKRSFSFVFNHLEPLLKMSLLWGLLLTILEAVEGFPSLCVTEECISQGAIGLSSIVAIASSISITISYIIFVINRTENKSFFNLRFGKKDFRYLWASIKLLFASVAIAFLISFVISILGKLLGLSITKSTIVMLFLITIFFVAMFLSRYVLVFPAIALDNQEIGFKKSYELLRGNINTIFWGTVIISLPVNLLNIFIVSFYMAIGKNIYADIAFSFVLVMLGFLSIALKASFYAHIYQYVIYFYNKNKNKENAA